MLSTTFLPSVEWLALARIPGNAVGILCAAFFAWRLSKRLDRLGSDLQKALVLTLSPLLLYFVAKSLVVIAVPVVLALTAGHQIELPFVVANIDGYSRGCPSPIYFREPPYPFDKICSVPQSVKDVSKPGTQVRVVGYGTKFGIFADHIR